MKTCKIGQHFIYARKNKARLCLHRLARNVSTEICGHQLGPQIRTAVVLKFSTYQGATSKYHAPEGGDMKQVSRSGLRSCKLNSTKCSHPVFANPRCKHWRKYLRRSSRVWMPMSRLSLYAGLFDICNFMKMRKSA
jgi:hypothetical protein